MGYTVEERKVSVQELIDAYKNGHLTEAFGTGTAAVISPIGKLGLAEDAIVNFDVEKFKIANEIKAKMNEIRLGLVPDSHNWLVKI